MKSKIAFGNEKIEESFKKLKNSKTEDRNLYKWIKRAFEDLEEDAFCSIQIHKKLIPKEYIRKYGIDNLWKYDLPKGWKLLYSVTDAEIIVISIIIEWLNHKGYDRKFKY